jgi:hypothetical protein
MSETPETLGNLLRSHATHAKNTCEAKRQISRVDAVCWFLSKVSMASAKEVKRFVTAFKGKPSWYSKRRGSGTDQGVERCYALLNTAYGGVGMDVLGTQRVCFSGSHYGPVSPLYRPQPRHYAITVAGARRAERVEAFLAT